MDTKKRKKKHPVDCPAMPLSPQPVSGADIDATSEGSGVGEAETSKDHQRSKGFPAKDVGFYRQIVVSLEHILAQILDILKNRPILVFILMLAAIFGICFVFALKSDLPAEEKFILATVLIVILAVFMFPLVYLLVQPRRVQSLKPTLDRETLGEHHGTMLSTSWLAILFKSLFVSLFLVSAGWGLQTLIFPIRVFKVETYFSPSGKLGDVNDVELAKPFYTYHATGIGPHLWDYTYVSGKSNPEPAQFAGVAWLYPQNSFGQSPGYDLRRFRGKIRWEARSAGEPVKVEFFIGGINWNWGITNGLPAKVTPPFPDSMLRITIADATLTSEWKQFEFPLETLPKNYFANVVCAFGWIAEWGPNGVKLNESRTGAVNAGIFEIEIRNISYLSKDYHE